MILPTTKEGVSTVSETILSKMGKKEIFPFITTEGLKHAAVDCSKILGFNILSNEAAPAQLLQEQLLKAQIKYFEGLARGEEWRDGGWHGN